MTYRARTSRRCRECRYWQKTQRGYGVCTHEAQYYGKGPLSGQRLICPPALMRWEEFRRKEEASWSEPSRL